MNEKLYDSVNTLSLRQKIATINAAIPPGIVTAQALEVAKFLASPYGQTYINTKIHFEDYSKIFQYAASVYQQHHPDVQLAYITLDSYTKADNYLKTIAPDIRKTLNDTLNEIQEPDTKNSSTAREQWFYILSGILADLEALSNASPDDTGKNMITILIIIVVAILTILKAPTES